MHNSTRLEKAFSRQILFDVMSSESGCFGQNSFEILIL